MPKQKQISTPVGIIIIIVAIAILFGGVFTYQYFVIKNQVVQAPQVKNIIDQTAGWKTYSNTEYGFEIKYPEKAVVETGISSAEVNSKWFKIKVPIISNAEAAIMISFPQGEMCGAYGPGVASKHVSEEIMFNNKKYNFGGWVEDAENYIKWAEENPQYGGVTPRKTDPNYKRYYQKTMTLCGDTFQVNYSISFENLLNQNDLTVVENLLKQILSTFKFTTSTDQTIGLNQIATDLMNGYLGQYELPSVASNKRLVSYKINNITADKFDETNQCFFFSVDYSVETAVKPIEGNLVQSDWVAGNGTMGTDNWINNKANVFNVVKEGGDTYKIVAGGTGGASGSCANVDKYFTPFSLKVSS